MASAKKTASQGFHNNLERLYQAYNRRSLVRPDPLVFLYDYPKVEDREIVGLIAALLAYGRVEQILKSVGRVLTVMGAPRQYLVNNDPASIRNDMRGFRHRFTGGEDLSLLLVGMKAAISEFGSLEACFSAGVTAGDENVMPALERFVETLSRPAGNTLPFLLPLPSKGSACKRLHLFLRWMIRKDRVDPGGWRQVPPSKLMVPMDTHMHRIATSLGLTSRKSPNLKAVEEVTAAFRRMVPEDPVRYDFALTRSGIRPDCPLEPFLSQKRSDC